MAEAMREVLSHPEEAQRRAQAGRELVRQEFDSTTNYARLKTCLEKAAGPTAAGPANS